MLKKQKPPLSGGLLDDSCFSERFERALLVHSLDTSSRNEDSNMLLEFRDVYSALLEVRVASGFSGRVKLRSTGSVAETPADH